MVKILVVEDDAAILESVAFNLERDGHEVILAADGMRGLALARSEQPALIVLDLMLPRMSGEDVCRLVRAEYDMPILMLTARDAEADTVLGLELGADDYVTKPFSMRELRARVAALLRRDARGRQREEGEAPAADIVGGPITLSPARHEVERDGVSVRIRPKEFELLEYLMRHPGQVLSRERILEAVWGYSYTGGTRTVDVHIRWLREKLEPEPSEPVHLLTVRGVGYKFQP